MVLYVHGGGYYGEINKYHWAFLGQCVDATGCSAEVPIYGLAPDHGPEEALALIALVYDELLHSHAPGDVVVAGDSAGGALALALVQRLVAEQRPLPGRLLLLAPWLDLMMRDGAADAIDHLDPILSLAGSREAGKTWAGELNHSDPRVSPINGSVIGLPPIDLWVGTRDIFVPYCRRLRDLVIEAGGDVRYDELNGGLHVYVLAPLPEGRRARKRIIEDLRTHFSSGE